MMNALNDWLSMKLNGLNESMYVVVPTRRIPLPPPAEVPADAVATTIATAATAAKSRRRIFRATIVHFLSVRAGREPRTGRGGGSPP